MVFSQLFPFVALTRFWVVCFRSKRLRLARLMGEFSDSFLTVVVITAMLYWLRSVHPRACGEQQTIAAACCSSFGSSLRVRRNSYILGFPF